MFYSKKIASRQVIKLLSILKIIAQIDSFNNPVFKCSIVVHEDLTLHIYNRNICAPPSQYRHIISGKVSRISEVCNLMAFQNSNGNDVIQKTTIERWLYQRP